MAKYDALCPQPARRREVLFDDRWIRSFIGRIEAGDLKPVALQLFEEMSCATEPKCSLKAVLTACSFW
jgi:hypothetical protein